MTYVPPTITRLKLRTEVREALGEPSVEKTWKNSQLNRYINDALRDMCKYGVLKGSRTTTVSSADTEFDIPSEFLRLVRVNIGTTEYKLVHKFDEAQVAYKYDTVVVDEENWTITFNDGIAVGVDIVFSGNLWHNELDPDSSADDSTVIAFDPRWSDTIVNYVLAKALRVTEDDTSRWMAEYEKELERFGYGAKIAQKAQYFRSERRQNDCSRF